MLRDIPKEILEVKSRHDSNAPRWKQYMVRFKQLDAVIHFLDAGEMEEKDEIGRQECIRYIPICIIACIQGYFRFVFRDLIDHGSPFSDRANKINSVRYDTSSVIALTKQKITAGEMVSHFIPCNNLDDINGAVTTLCDEDFRSALKAKEYDATAKTGKVYTAEVIMPRAYFHIENTFKKRNIFCHELAPKETHKLDEAKLSITAMSLFMNACEKYFESKLKTT